MIQNFPFLQSSKFFPHYVKLNDNETISVDSRSRLGKAGIIDIYCNGSHIGMFIGVKKTLNKLIFGPVNLNKPYKFRNILPYVFLKLIEYYGIDGVNSIEVYIPEDPEFKRFLKKLGFKLVGDQFIFEINNESIQALGKELMNLDVTIRIPQGQIKALIEFNNSDKPKEEIQKLANNILNKIKDEGELDKTYWDNRKASQINLMINCAKLLEDKLEKEEFLDMIIKTMISSFDMDVRLPLLPELFKALKGKSKFNAEYIQKMIDKLREILSEEIKHLDKEKYKAWINENMKAWKIHEEIIEKSKVEKAEKSKLYIKDFGPEIKNEIKEVLDAIIKHYNKEVIFYGLKTRI